MHVQLNSSILMNKKVSRLCRLLDINKRQAIGYLAVLWLHAVHEAEDGVLEGYTMTDFDDILYSTESTAIVHALVQCGLLRETQDGYEVTGWSEHTGGGLTLRAKQKEKRRKYMEKYRKGSKKSDGYPDHLENGDPAPP